MTDCRQIRWEWLLAPALLSAALYLTALGRRGDLDGHEVLVAQTAREMLQTGDWIHPQFAGEPRLQKPPLAYWLSAGSYWIAGSVNEFSARLPMAICAIGLVVLVAFWSERTFGPGVGCCAGLVQATSYWAVTYGKLSLVDMPLTLLTAFAIFCGWRTLSAGPAPRHCVFMFWLTAGLTVLAKGPVALGIIFPTLLLAKIITGKQQFPSARNEMTVDSRRSPIPFHILGLTTFLFLVLAWPITIFATRPEAAQVWFEQSLGRYAVHYGPQTRPWHFYLWQVALLTLPWSPLWIVRLWQVIRRNRDLKQDEAMLWTWLAVGVVFLSLSSGKREHYVLPALVPTSILAGLEWRRWQVRRQRLRIGYTNRWILAATTMATSATVFVVEGNVRAVGHSRPALRALIDRNRSRINEAACIIQLGSNDHSTAFFVDRPMTWLRDWDVAKMAPGANLLLVRQDEDFAQIAKFGTLVDSSANAGERDVPSRELKESWLLIKPNSCSESWVKKQNRPGHETKGCMPGQVDPNED